MSPRRCPNFGSRLTWLTKTGVLFPWTYTAIGLVSLMRAFQKISQCSSSSHKLYVSCTPVRTSFAPRPRGLQGNQYLPHGQKELLQEVDSQVFNASLNCYAKDLNKSYELLGFPKTNVQINSLYWMHRAVSFNITRPMTNIFLTQDC